MQENKQNKYSDSDSISNLSKFDNFFPLHLTEIDINYLVPLIAKEVMPCQ
jgi:hypothetical protein